MTLPTPWTIIEVYGQSVDKQGNPNTGTITFVMLQPLVVDSIEVTQANLIAVLDETGSFTVQLPATDDPNVAPQGAAYMVYEQYATGLARPPYAIPVTYTAAGGRLNLFEIAPLVPPPDLVSTIGPRGYSLYTGTGAPSNGIGNDGDTYIDAPGGVVYGPKAGGVWPTPGTVINQAQAQAYAAAALASAQAAASSASSAAGSATTATTQAGNASTSATNAAASATTASTAATTATTQAGIATTQAAAAAASAASVYGDLASTAPGKGAALVAYLSGTVKSFLDSLSASGSTVGAFLVGFQQAGTGAVSRTAQDKSREHKSVADVLPANVLADVTSGSPVLDHTTYLQQALTNYVNLDLGDSTYKYRVSAALTLQSNQRVTGHGATLTQISNLTPIFTFDSQTNVLVERINFVGVGTDFNNSPGSLACGIRAWYAANVTVRNCTLTNFGNTGVSFAFGANLNVYDNTVIGPGNPILTAGTSGGNVGVLIDKGCSYAFVARNNISKTAQGIQTGDSCSDVSLVNNIIQNIAGQHGIYAGGAQKNLIISLNTVDTCPLEGIKVQQYDTPGADTVNVQVNNNIVANTGSHGIALLSTTSSPTYLIRNAQASSNILTNIGVGNTADAITLNACVGVSSIGNTINGCTRDGMRVSAIVNADLSHNVINAPLCNGINEILACTNVSAYRNQIYNPAGSLTASNTNGINVMLGSGWFIEKNIIIDTASKMRYGVIIQGGTYASDVVVGNLVQGATDYGFRIIGTTPTLLRYADNVWGGTLGTTLNAPATNQLGNTGRAFYGTAIPSTGTWLVGDVMANTTPTAGGPAEWVCTTAGTPGTWKVSKQAGVMTSIAATPAYIGQVAVVGAISYMASNTSAPTDWKQISN